jgi:hypothetical protein
MSLTSSINSSMLLVSSGFARVPIPRKVESINAIMKLSKEDMLDTRAKPKRLMLQDVDHRVLYLLGPLILISKKCLAGQVYSAALFGSQ